MPAAHLPVAARAQSLGLVPEASCFPRVARLEGEGYGSLRGALPHAASGGLSATACFRHNTSFRDTCAPRDTADMGEPVMLVLHKVHDAGTHQFVSRVLHLAGGEVKWETA